MFGLWKLLEILYTIKKSTVRQLTYQKCSSINKHYFDPQLCIADSLFNLSEYEKCVSTLK
jgi:hypothetical protein